MPQPIRLIAMGVLAMLVPAGARGQASVADIPARIDRLFAPWQRADSPGCAVGVSRGGSTILERGYGRASLELGVPIAPESVFHVASVTKQFTAMSILLLAADGRLSLEDDVRRHLPEWQGPPGITLRHLLTHTSGLRDAFLLIELAAPQDGSRSRHDQLVALLARQHGVIEPPGRRYYYNNGGYVLLADIVKRVSGRSLAAFATERIFQPLDMRHTHLHEDADAIVPMLAAGYTRGGDGVLRVARRLDGVVGNAGLFTTVGDLLRWERNFAAPRVGDAALVASMETPPQLPDGEPTVYGLGLQIERPGGRRTVGHGGGDQGASAYVVRYPDDDFAVAVLCNVDDIDSITLARGVANAYLGDAAAVPEPARAPAVPPIASADLAANEGLYRDPVDETLLRIFVRDGTLYGSPGAGADGGWAVVPLGANRFAIPTTPITLTFAPGAGGGRTLRIVGERPRPMVLERVTPYAPAAAALMALAGEYRSEELSTTYALRVRDGGLIAEVPGRAPIVLQPIRPDTFAGSLVGVVTFTRDTAGRGAGFTVHTYAARGVRFERVGRGPRR